MTVIGASSARPEVIEAVRSILPRFVEIDALQQVASRTIARLCGAEAGFVTASTAAGITLAVAGAMTGLDRPAIARLPDASGLKYEVAVMAGHLISYGAPVEQAVRLAGAEVVSVGQATSVAEYELEAALTERTAAALYVISHHAVQYGMLGLRRFSEIAHAHGVPVIVDAAAEYGLRRFIEEGADIALYSAHKFLRAPTAGIVAGRRDLVRAAYLQNGGIGRGMKVGKEGIAGTIVALEAWETTDHAGQRAAEAQLLALWQAALAGRPGVTASIVADPTGNPVDRLGVSIDPALAKTTAWNLTSLLAAGTPSVAVRAEALEHGYFELDPCNLDAAEAKVVAAALVAVLEASLGGGVPMTSYAEWFSARESEIWDI
ncbi:aminotransferase class V-fold PLP-dependent enzyme [Devosia sp. Root413D1]|uniref:aminotransferase class V-fold PLP-dependent enzyme n=1 Tax=Devosia sp. Root413D1 TaxID=1736531 RepID=UPI0009E7DEF3|nr:aminotransferase class V-fold PLP-dependent enzyme [Devosia sp. Root413D1]